MCIRDSYKRVPTAEADIQITPSEGKDTQPGDSDLVVTWKQAFPLRLTLTADNSGTQATGKLQGSATLSADNLLGLQDLFYITFSHDLNSSTYAYGTQGNSVYYGIPLALIHISIDLTENAVRLMQKTLTRPNPNMSTGYDISESSARP